MSFKHQSADPAQGFPDVSLLVQQPLPAWIIDAEHFHIHFANAAATELYGYSATAFQSMGFEELFMADSSVSFFHELARNRNAAACQAAHHTAGGQTLHVLLYAARIHGHSGFYQVTAVDVTAQKKTEEDLRVRASLVEQTSDVLTAADIHYRPVTWNQAAEKLYGLPAAQVIGRDLREFISVHYDSATREQVRDQIAEKGEWRGEAWFIRPSDNKIVTVIIGFKIFLDQQGRCAGYIVSATDITERKLAESRLRESESRFRDMADSSPSMIWMADEHNISTYVNEAWMAFTGKDVVGAADGWEKLVHPNDQQRVLAAYRQSFEAREMAKLTYRLRRSDGSYRWVHDIGAPRLLSDGTFVGYIGSLVDIEDQKQKQEKLLYQATLLENVSDIVVATDLDFRVRSWNRIAEQYYGITEAEAIGRNLNELVQFTFYGSSTAQARMELKRTGKWQGEVSIPGKDGNAFYFLHTVKYVYDDNGNKAGFLALARDVTARRLAEEQLKKSEEFYRTLIANSLDGMLLVDPEGNISFASPSVKNVLGFEVDELEGTNGFSYVHPEDLPTAADAFRREMEGQPDVKFIVVRLLKKSGDWVWCMVRGHSMLKNSAVNRLVIYFHDDTLRRQATEALKESETRFRNLIRDLQIGVVIQDPEGNTILCNDEFAEIFGTTKEAIMGKPIQQIVIDPVHEDGRPFSKEERPTYKAMTTGKMSKDVLMGLRRPGQEHHVWVLVNADPVLDQQGNLVQIVCSVKDITERKLLQEKQISHQRQLTQATIDGQEKERREIGKELHDNIGQQLTTIKLFLDLAKTTADDGTNEMVMMALKGVSDVINDVRSMSRALVPSTLRDLGLVDSIRELCDSIRLTQLLEIKLHHADFDEDQLPDNQKLTIFRIVQEQLNNIVRHAGATTVQISIGCNGTLLELRIQDDGHGFDIRKVRKGLGFTNISNRAELFNGRADVHSRPGEGCLLLVSMPFLPSDVTVS